MSAGFALLLGAAYAHSQVAGGVAGAGNAGGTVTATVSVGSPGLSGVKGAPFSADIIDEFEQMLVNGTHIHREIHGQIFRDSEGRTRKEDEYPFDITFGEKHRRVMITDPVQQVFIILNPQTKVATIQHVEPRAPKVAAVANKPVAAPPPQADPPKINPLQFEQLGTMQIEGFMASGQRMTRTVEAGRIGNDKPIVSVDESWYSTELKEMLLTKSDNPQSGQHIRRLVNIRIGDPDPLLFQLPSDYAVKDISR